MMTRKVLLTFPVLFLLAIFLISPLSMAQGTAGGLSIISHRDVATPTTIIYRLPMVQDDASNTDYLMLTNLGTTATLATIRLYDTAGETTTRTTNILPKQFYIDTVSRIRNIQGIFGLEVETLSTVVGLVITGPEDLHSVSFRELWPEPFSSESRTINVPLVVHVVHVANAQGHIFLTNFSTQAQSATITLYDLATGLQVIEQIITVNPHVVRRIPLTELIGPGQEGIFAATITAPGAILGVYTLTDADNDKAYYPFIH